MQGFDTARGFDSTMADALVTFPAIFKLVFSKLVNGLTDRGGCVGTNDISSIRVIYLLFVVQCSIKNYKFVASIDVLDLRRKGAQLNRVDVILSC